MAINILKSMAMNMAKSIAISISISMEISISMSMAIITTISIVEANQRKRYHLTFLFQAIVITSTLPSKIT